MSGRPGGIYHAPGRDRTHIDLEQSPTDSAASYPMRSQQFVGAESASQNVLPDPLANSERQGLQSHLQTSIEAISSEIVSDLNLGETAAPTKEDQGYKLFIGQIPKDLIEEDIFPVFASFGPILELEITREPLTSIKSIKYNIRRSKLGLDTTTSGYHQLSRGYGFVTYLNEDDSKKCKVRKREGNESIASIAISIS